MYTTSLLNCNVTILIDDTFPFIFGRVIATKEHKGEIGLYVLDKNGKTHKCLAEHVVCVEN